MKKGQLFIATITMIGIVISGLIGLTYTLNLEPISLYGETSSVPTAKRSLEKELIIITDMDPQNTTRINNFTEKMKNHLETKGINLEVNWRNTSPSSKSECDAYLQKSHLPINKSLTGRIFNITVHDPGEMKVNSFVEVCWS